MLDSTNLKNNNPENNILTKDNSEEKRAETDSVFTRLF